MTVAATVSMTVLAPVLASFAVGVIAWAVDLVGLRIPAVRKHRNAVGCILSGGVFASCCGLLKLSGVSVVQLGGWAAPFGITYVADHLGAAAAIVIGAVSLLFHVRQWLLGESLPPGGASLIHFFTAGTLAACLAGDVFHLYVCFEIVILAGAGCIALRGDASSLDAAIQFILVSMVGSMFFLMGAGLLYHSTGTLNLADVSEVLAHGTPPLLTLVSLFLFLGIAMKVALFPMHGWLFPAYTQPSIGTAAWMAAVSTKMGVVVFLRVWIHLDQGTTLPFLSEGIRAVGACTWLVGLAGSLVQVHLRRWAACTVMSHSGFALVLLSFMNADNGTVSVASALVFLGQGVLVSSCMFWVVGLIERYFDTDHLHRVGSLWDRDPWATAILGGVLLSGIGVPPFLGFWPKWTWMQSASMGWVAWTLLMTLGAALASLRIWNAVVWKPAVRVPLKVPRSERWAHRAPMTVVVLASVLFVMKIEWLEKWSLGTAKQLLDRTAYRERVLRP